MIKLFSNKKEELSETYKKMLKDLCLFYEMNKSLFDSKYSNQKEKKEIIKLIYKIVNYSNLPLLSYNQNKFNEANNKIYRGISALNRNLLNQYINDFINGEPFYGGRASIYGTGIYTVIGNDSKIANDYATDGETNEHGIVIEALLANNTKIIESSKIEEIRNIMFEKIKKIYPNNIENYLDVLQDDGALACLIGYDAILVENKNYMIVLNREKLIVNASSIDNIIKKDDNYSKM